MKIYVIQANPEKKSFCGDLAETYAREAAKCGHDVKLCHLSDLNFDPILRRNQALEPDLVTAQQNIIWCEKIVFFYPIWWGTWPALLKGFVDRTFQSGVAYKYHLNGPFWDKLLKGRKAHVITTSDAPTLWIWWQYRSADRYAMKKATLEFCGFTPVKYTRIDRVRFMDQAQRSTWIERVGELARKAE